MATLHVRNVPDDLYERLRRQAEGNGRSIGAEAVQLLDERLGGAPRRGLRRRRGPAPGERMGDAGHAVIASAQEEARALGHSYIGTEHLLLGVLAHRALPGLELEQARADAERIVGRGEGAPEDTELPFTARAKKALELAVQEAYPAAVEPEHIAHGIRREGEGVGFELLDAAPPAPPFRVVELEGAAPDWETRLNSAAAEGYELVSIVDRRAILRL
jgi:hypothetical protein